MKMDNYQAAQNLLLNNSVSEELICQIGYNRKSRKYDKSYYPFYQKLKAVFLEKSDDVVDLFNKSNALNIGTRTQWKNLLFNTTKIQLLKQKKRAALVENNPFFNCQSEQEFKLLFFKYLHIFKAKATLSDYFDLNKRYFSLTDTLIFQDEKVIFDLFPKYFFKIYINDIYQKAFIPYKELAKNVELSDLFMKLTISPEKIYQLINQDVNSEISSTEQAEIFIKREREKRFQQLLEVKFTPQILLNLLLLFEQRDDQKIMELVTDDADIPTIFEYILAIIWYQISEQQGDILAAMNLSLDANLLPKTHAAGGSADIVYQYKENIHYPAHTLLIEATLSDSTNQRRMELEPVSRHLGEHLLRSKNNQDYAIFISTYLNKNVVSDFRSRKYMPYFSQRNDEMIEGMKIVSLDTEILAILLKNHYTYADLYLIFEKYHRSDILMPQWFEQLKSELLQL